MTRLLCSAAKAGRSVSHQTAWIESGEAAEGRDQRRGKHNENRDDPHLDAAQAATERATGFTKNGDRGGKYGFLTHQVFTFLEAVYIL